MASASYPRSVDSTRQPWDDGTVTYEFHFESARIKHVSMQEEGDDNHQGPNVFFSNMQQWKKIDLAKQADRDAKLKIDLSPGEKHDALADDVYLTSTCQFLPPIVHL